MASAGTITRRQWRCGGACRLGHVALLLLAAVCCGCSHVDWHRIGAAAEQAATDPLSWGGTGAAALFAVNGNSLDVRLSDWARRNTPVFGSRQKALNASDTLRDTADYGAKLTALLVPTPKRGNDWLWDKTQTLVLESVSASMTLNTTGVLKRATDRRRPGNSDSTDSFPSAHASSAFNVQQFRLPSPARNLLSAGFLTLAGGTAWARVEGGVHYPSDVLFGAALGNFFAIFIHEGFIRNTPHEPVEPMQLSVSPSADGLMLNLSGMF
jgi:membrane-associated phospholipid phosphatase